MTTMTESEAKLHQAIVEYVAEEYDNALVGAYVMSFEVLDLNGSDDMFGVQTNGSGVAQRGLAEMLRDTFIVVRDDEK